MSAYQFFVCVFFFSRTLATVKISKVKFVIWSNDMSTVALISKHGKSFVQKSVTRQCTLTVVDRVYSVSCNGVKIVTHLFPCFELLSILCSIFLQTRQNTMNMIWSVLCPGLVCPRNFSQEPISDDFMDFKIKSLKVCYTSPESCDRGSDVWSTQTRVKSSEELCAYCAMLKFS